MRLHGTFLILGVMVFGIGCGSSSAPPAETPQASAYTTEQYSRWRAMLSEPGLRYAVNAEGLPCVGPQDALVTVVGFENYESDALRDTFSIAMDHATSIRFCAALYEAPDAPSWSTTLTRVAAYIATQVDSETFFVASASLHLSDGDQTNDDGTTRDPDIDRVVARAALSVNLSPQAVQDGARQMQSLGTLNASGRVSTDVPGQFALLVNGRPFSLENDQPLSELIDEELRLAQRLIADGVQARDLTALCNLVGIGVEDPAEQDDAEPAPDTNEPELAVGEGAPQQPSVQPAAPAPTFFAVPVQGRPQRGPSDALVTLVIFSDFECPFCSRLVPTLAQHETEFGRDLRIVFRHYPLPFHSHATDAARAADEVFRQRGNDAFFRMHDLMFANQRALTMSDLESYAVAAGANLARFRRAMRTGAHTQTVQDDIALGQQIGVSGTPASFVNGEFLSGAQPLAAFQTTIRAALASAQARVANGTPRANVYAEILREGLTRAAPPAPRVAPPALGIPAAPTTAHIPLPQTAPSRGPANAAVTIQIFSDFQCPFCSRVAPTLEQLHRQYGNRVRFVWRNYPLPFHQDAFLAAEAAMEVFSQRGNTAFWQYHDLLFANQRTLSRADLERYATQIRGVNLTRFRLALDQHTHQARVQADMDAVGASGISIGTPSFLIDDEILQGAQPVDAFVRVIDRHLAD